MARKKGLYSDKISADGRSVTRHLKEVSFILRKPRPVKKAKSIRDRVHVSVILRRENALTGLNGSDIARLTLREASALGVFIRSWSYQTRQTGEFYH